MDQLHNLSEGMTRRSCANHWWRQSMLNKAQHNAGALEALAMGNFMLVGAATTILILID
jgi:hypothetical protein